MVVHGRVRPFTVSPHLNRGRSPHIPLAPLTHARDRPGDRGTVAAVAVPALDTTTLFPLTRDGYLSEGTGIASKLRGGALTSYDSPDNPTANHDFYAVMTHRVADLQLLVADTDEYPGHAGTDLGGLYWIRGATLVAVGEDT